jgi:hypothetical protein
MDEQEVGCQCTNVQRSDPDIVADSNNNPHVFCGTEYAKLVDGKWELIPPGINRDTELVIDNKDIIYLVHRGGNNGGYIGIKKLVPGKDSWENLTDPDKNSPGPNDHVYCDIAVSPVDNSLHLVQRHGHTLEVNYRASFDCGLSWPVDIPVHAERSEAPHITIDNNGKVYITTGHGRALYFDGRNFTDEGIVVHGNHRRQPELIADVQNNIYTTCFEGQFNIRNETGWGVRQYLPNVSGAEKIGFVEAAAAQNSVYIVWEEGSGNTDTGLLDSASIFVAKLTSDGNLIRF